MLSSIFRALKHLNTGISHYVQCIEGTNAGVWAQGKIRAENPFALGLGIPRLPNGKSKGFSAQIFPDLLNLKHGSFSGLRAGVFSPDSPLRPLQKVLEKKAQGPKFPKSNGRGTWKSQAQGKGKHLEKRAFLNRCVPKVSVGRAQGNPYDFPKMAFWQSTRFPRVLQDAHFWRS